MTEKKTLVIGIAGGTGSGKTTFAEKISEEFGDSLCRIEHDSYYKRHDELTYEERTHLNYDCPDAFDTDLLISHIGSLLSGEAVDVPVYDYTVHNRSDRTVRVSPAPILLIEGILIFAEPRLAELMDVRIFVDTDADIRILRRIRRDMRERERSFESVMEQYMTTVKPMHDKYVEPSKKLAHLIVPEGGHNEVALASVSALLHTYLTETGRQ